MTSGKVTREIMHAKRFYSSAYNGRVIFPDTSQENTQLAELFTATFPSWPLDGDGIVSSRHYQHTYKSLQAFDYEVSTPFLFMFTVSD